MKKPKILMVNNVPIREPLEGGKQRVYFFREGWRSAGFHVDLATVYDSRHDDLTGDDLAFSLEGLEYLRPDYLWEFDDYLIGKLAARTARAVDWIVKRIESEDYDIIDLEHPWLWPLLRVALPRLKRKTPAIIYNSHNVEFEVKKQLAAKHEGNSIVAKLLEEQKRDELDLVARAALVFTCSARDGEIFAPYANRVVEAPNGVRGRTLDFDERRRALGRTPYCLFVGSNWSPNIDGFCAYAEELARQLPGGKIVLVGGAAEPIRERLSEFLPSTLLRRIRFEGRVSEKRLTKLLSGARCYVIPIYSGGGSNIKTAEALASGLPVVATSFAMRGFERYLNGSLINIYDQPAQFASAVAAIFRARESRDATNPNTQELLWESRVLATVKTLESLA